MEFIQSRELPDSIRALKKVGGPFTTAANRVNALIGEIASGVENPLAGWQVTNKGESRIPKCVKYDITARARLVTVQNERACILLYAGSHEDAERWIERHRGVRFKADSKGHITIARPAVFAIADREVGDGYGLSGSLFEHLDPDLYDRLVEGLGKPVRRWLEQMKAGDHEELAELQSELGADEQSEAVIAVFACLLREDVTDANDRIRDYLGELQELDEVEYLFDSDRFSIIPRNHPDYRETFLRLMQTENYKSWMLFMHPEQERVACEEFDGPAKLLGVSGSGKTCVVVRRALELSLRYPGEKILVLTLNPPLASLIRDLVVEAGGPSALDSIRVDPLFSICQEILRENEPQNTRHYSEVTWKADEHVDEIWREYYRCELNNHDAACLLPVHDSLIARGIEAEKYIRQEFDWIRSAFPPDRRERYLTAERKGRTHPLSPKFRELVLEGLAGWERKLWAVGVTDYLGVATAAYRYIPELQPRYRCVIVDECQDFGTTELSIVRRLAAKDVDDIFLCGDAAQQVSSKFQSVQAAGISTHATRNRELRRNYRNSRDILKAAFGVLYDNLDDAFFDNTDFEVIDPAFADSTGPTPLILEADSLEQEIANAIAYIRELHAGKVGRKALIAIAGLTNFEIGRYARRQEVDLPFLRPDASFSEQEIYLSDLDQSKGFEFDTVCIVNCREGILPDGKIPEDEQYRDLARLYVTMTRAKVNLILSWSKRISTYLAAEIYKSGSGFLAGSWKEMLPELPNPMPLPLRLGDLRSHDEGRIEATFQTASQFLYTQHAIGLTTTAIEQLRKYVTGTSRTQGPRKERMEWKDLGSAIRDLRRDPAARKRFGPETSEYLLDRLGGLITSQVADCPK